MSREIGIYASMYNPDIVHRTVDGLEQSGIKPRPLDIHGSIPSSISTIGVIGGDGLTGAAINRLLNEDRDVTLLAFGGGTNNAFRRTAISEGAGVPIETLRARLENPRPLERFQPGVIGSKAFSSDVGVGVSEPMIAAWNAYFREYVKTGDVRPALAAFASWFAMWGKQFEGVPPFELYTAGRFYGRREMFPDQRILGKEITRARIDAASKPAAMIKLLWAFGCLGFGFKTGGKLVFKTERAEQFQVTHQVKQSMLSGDHVEEDFGQPIVGRSPRSLPFAAVIL